MIRKSLISEGPASMASEACVLVIRLAADAGMKKPPRSSTVFSVQL